MRIEDIMMHVVAYANLTTDCRDAIEGSKLEELKKFEIKKDAMFNKIMTLIKMSQQDAVISELKLAVSNLSNSHVSRVNNQEIPGEF